MQNRNGSAVSQGIPSDLMIIGSILRQNEKRTATPLRDGPSSLIASPLSFMRKSRPKTVGAGFSRRASAEADDYRRDSVRLINTSRPHGSATTRGSKPVERRRFNHVSRLKIPNTCVSETNRTG